jgi:hypothetical protein
MDTLEATLSVSNTWSGSRTEDAATDPNVGDRYETELSFVVGTGDGKINATYSEIRELAASANETIDLTSLVNKYSNLYESFGFATVKTLSIEVIENADNSAQASAVRVGNAASNQFDGWLSAAATHDVRKNGVYAVGDDVGQTVDATHKNLKVANLDGSNKATYRITVNGIKV